jgi:hypothetical protein
MSARIKPSRKTTAGSISTELRRKIRIIAAHRDMDFSAVLDKYAAPIIDRELRKIREEDRELGEAGA